METGATKFIRLRRWWGRRGRRVTRGCAIGVVSTFCVANAEVVNEAAVMDEVIIDGITASVQMGSSKQPVTQLTSNGPSVQTIRNNERGPKRVLDTHGLLKKLQSMDFTIPQLISILKKHQQYNVRKVDSFPPLRSTDIIYNIEKEMTGNWKLERLWKNSYKVTTDRGTFVLKVFAEPQKWINEVIMLKLLSHPNIVEMYFPVILSEQEGLGQFHKHGTVVGIVEEYVVGDNCVDFIKKSNYSDSEAVRLCLDIAKTMQFLHEESIIYADLKPDNIIIVDDNGRKTAKLIDFDLSLPSSVETTRVGTRGYMAPEVDRDNPKISGAADVFSFGCLLYDFLSRLENDLDVLCEECKSRPIRARSFSGGSPAGDCCQGQYASIFGITMNVHSKKRMKEKCKNETQFTVDNSSSLGCLSRTTEINLRRLILWCWQKNPSKRPTFANIIEVLENGVCVFQVMRKEYRALLKKTSKQLMAVNKKPYLMSKTELAHSFDLSTNAAGTIVPLSHTIEDEVK